MAAIFDKYADIYDEGHRKAVAMSGFSPDYFHEYKFKEVVRYLREKGLADKKIKLLDFGCGIGRSVSYFKKNLRNVSFYGIDISGEEIRVAKASNNKLNNVIFSTFDGFNIPFKTKFDVIFVANVFHHIKRQDQEKALKNIVNYLADKGYLFIFEHNPINPLTQWIYYRNDFLFDKNSNLLTPMRTNSLLKKVGLMNNEVNFAIFFPGFLSGLIPFEKYLRWLPLGAHYFYVAKK